MKGPRTSTLSDIGAIRSVLESERKVEREFVDRARQSEKAPKGWPAALVMFHVGMWRERMRDALTAAIEDREYTAPGTADEINDAELAAGIGTPLTDAAARAEHLLTEISDLLERAGDRHVQWYAAATATDAVLRNSYSHPRSHICAYLAENGDVVEAQKLIDDGLHRLAELSAPEYVTKVLTILQQELRA